MHPIERLQAGGLSRSSQIFGYNNEMLKRIPLVFSPQPEGGFTVTSPVIPELITEGDSLEEAYLRDVFEGRYRVTPHQNDLIQIMAVASDSCREALNERFWSFLIADDTGGPPED